MPDLGSYFFLLPMALGTMVVLGIATLAWRMTRPVHPDEESDDH